LAAFEGVTQSYLVGVLKVNANGQTAREACDFYGAVADLLLNIECG
jgi:hypothetical protein